MSSTERRHKFFWNLNKAAFFISFIFSISMYIKIFHNKATCLPLFLKVPPFCHCALRAEGCTWNHSLTVLLFLWSFFQDQENEILTLHLHPDLSNFQPLSLFLWNSGNSRVKEADCSAKKPFCLCQPRSCE